MRGARGRERLPSRKRPRLNLHFRHVDFAVHEFGEERIANILQFACFPIIVTNSSIYKIGNTFKFIYQVCRWYHYLHRIKSVFIYGTKNRTFAIEYIKLIFQSKQSIKDK